MYNGYSEYTYMNIISLFLQKYPFEILIFYQKYITYLKYFYVMIHAVDNMI